MAVSKSANRSDLAYYPKSRTRSPYSKNTLRHSIHSAAESRSAVRKKAFIQATENPLLYFFSVVGGGIADSFYIAGVILGYLRKEIFVRQERRLYWRMKKLGIRFSYLMGRLGLAITLPFVKTVRGFYLMGQAVARQKGRPFGDKVMAAADVFYYGCRNNINMFKTMVNYILPVMGVVLFACVVNFTGSLSFAVAVSYNGEQIGYVSSEAVAEQAKQILTGRLVYLDDSERITITPSYSLEIVENTEMLNEYQLADELIQLSSDEIVTAKGLYVDNVFYGAAEGDGTELEATLQKVLDQYRTDSEDETVSFVNDVKVVPGLYITENIVSTDDLVAQVLSTDSTVRYYTASLNETAEEVADANRISVSELKKLNPDIEIDSKSTTFSEGQMLTVAEGGSFLPVQVTRTETYTEEVPYSTKTTKSADYMKGTTKTVKAGENGKNQVTAKVSYVDGSEVSREVLSTKVLSEPVTREVIQGTASPVSLSGSTGDGKIASGFIWPLSGSNRYVSSYYGSRSLGNHGGIDICLRGGTYGASVRASASGTVVFSGTNGSFGKLVRIDHGNGLQTYYAHNSQLLVSAGDHVAQGEVIAKAGATGRVTGPHVHFEVRVNGQRRNPINYLP